MTASRLSVLAVAVVCAVGALTAPAALGAGGARTVDLRHQPSFEIVGARPIDFAGSAVARGGDVNGDGIDDVLVAAPDADGPGRTDAGGSGRPAPRRAASVRPRTTSAASTHHAASSQTTTTTSMTVSDSPTAKPPAREDPSTSVDLADLEGDHAPPAPAPAPQAATIDLADLEGG